ncbi:MAG: hypothetical protein O7D97_05950, partial [Planctomycetota bacterium]|nr:hypothetical protein [Planctomycetota bacterium]
LEDQTYTGRQQAAPQPGTCRQRRHRRHPRLVHIARQLGLRATDSGSPPDFDGDGTVGILDLLTLLANWG